LANFPFAIKASLFVTKEIRIGSVFQMLQLAPSRQLRGLRAAVEVIVGKATAKAKAPARYYSPKTLKVLFALCGNKCAHPDCKEAIIANATRFSLDLVVGQISHIYAHSNKGPRGKPGLTAKERDQADNLMLFCPTHHVVVDGQHETYTATLLLEWKRKHERQYRDQISAKLTDIGYAELETAARALVSKHSSANGDYTSVPPKEKIEKNDLGGTSTMLLTVGAAKSREVERVLLDAAQFDEEFPNRLRAGFVAKYEEFRKQGLVGDDLLLAMYDWAGGDGEDKAREVAGLCILTHLFVICDVFEK
jgi:hypothetical protein